MSASTALPAPPVAPSRGPSIAVVIRAFESAATIARAVRSALAQPEASEVVVVDDGSTDGTAEFARMADDGSGRLRVVSQGNRGPSGAANRGQDETRASHFCILDSDDYFLPGRLGAIVDELGWDWDLAADRPVFVEEGREAGPFHGWRGRPPPSGRLGFRDFVLGNLSVPRRPKAELGYMQPVFRRAFLETLGLRHNEAVRIGEDFLLYAEALARGARFRLARNAGYVAVMRSHSLSARHGADDLARLLEADIGLLDLPELSDADLRVLLRHIRQVHCKLTYRRALDAKAKGGIVAGLAVGFGDWTTLPYLIRETVLARLPPPRPEPLPSTAAVAPSAAEAGTNRPKAQTEAQTEAQTLS
jgi:succinoglycan biosynthesis protein ExoU